MKLLVFGILLQILCISVSAQFYNGHAMLPKMREFQKMTRGESNASQIEAAEFAGYVLAVFDALSAGDNLICSHSGVTQLQVTMIAINYINAHPKRWNEPACYIITAAFLEAFECK